MNEATVLVTGGAGFIGCALAQRVAAEARRWVVLDNLHPQVHASGARPADLPDAAELVVGDVSDAATWDALLAQVRPDVVIHLAAETGTAQSLDEATRHAMVNLVGTTQMLDAFGRAGVEPAQIVLASSRAVYGEGQWRRTDGSVFAAPMRSHAQLEAGQWDFPDSEGLPSRADRTPAAPTSVYGATKLAQEHVLSAWAGARSTHLHVLRFQNVYGPGQSLTNSYTGIVSLFSQLARRGESIPLYEDGAITRDFVFIDDVAAAVVATLRRPDARYPYALDVGTGTGTTIAQLAEAIAAFHGAPAPHVTGRFRDGDVRHASSDIALTRAALDWEPAVDVVDGVARLQEWIARVDPR
ncbi:NAD-dependent epimerase/dehydratase family protein [Pseudolysinimonas yzui]|uniref:Epimerase/dehydratase n=1 Tax=Pseudolysinimonas yzui TaxID=2708254 RepID=A0A8J3M486_9MICO|nr:SDR family NAD(P)-dependent oxidoreductase [Pseudolysinimonas yzui]GHF15431.1 epimerase/dehydratase [Pseudolysinimonas yzui]